MELLRSLFSLVAYKMPLRSKSTICHYSNLSFFVLGFVRFSLSFSSQEEIVKRERQRNNRENLTMAFAMNHSLAMVVAVFVAVFYAVALQGARADFPAPAPAPANDG